MRNKSKRLFARYRTRKRRLKAIGVIKRCLSHNLSDYFFNVENIESCNLEVPLLISLAIYKKS